MLPQVSKQITTKRRDKIMDTIQIHKNKQAVTIVYQSNIWFFENISKMNS